VFTVTENTDVASNIEALDYIRKIIELPDIQDVIFDEYLEPWFKEVLESRAFDEAKYAEYS
jgi:hypothetical protein